MKSKLASLFLCIVMVTSISVPIIQNVGQSSSSLGGTIYVDDDNISGIEDGTMANPYNTIQEGVDAASYGGTIYVFNGTYQENVVLDKTINLIGEDRDTTIIDSGGSGSVINIKSNWVNVSGFKITGSDKWGVGIILNNVHNCCLENNNLDNNHYGIYIALSTNNKIYNNKMENCGISISYLSGKNTFTTQEIPTNNTVNNKPLYYYKNVNMNNVSVPLNAGQVILGDVSWLKIENLDVSDGSIGILLGYSSYNYIANNTCNSNDDCGIYIESSNNNTIVNNICDLNRAHGILLISHSNDNIVKNNKCYSNTITSGAGIALSEYSNENTIKYNTCKFNFRGINLDSSCNNTIINNDCSYNNEIGVFLTSSGNNIIDNNLFLSNGECGIYFDSFGSWQNTIKNNICSNNKYGIRFWIVVDNNTIRNNNITNNNYGIWLRLSSGNIIMDNNISANGNDGIYLFSSSNNNITYNNVSNNWNGIYLDSSSNNRVFHNNIIDNTNQAYDDRLDNYWDNGYPSGGNYWSDYTGVDNFNGPNQNIPGSDGIGDTPYPIPGGYNQDRYPLVPFEIYKQPPVADAGPNQIVNEGGVVQFDGSGSYVPNSTIDSYEWDFDADVDSDGDGNTTNDIDATGPTPTHVYGDDGNYTVTLTVRTEIESGGVVKIDQDVIFCVDISGSMTKKSVNLTKEGLSVYVNEMSYPDTGAVVLFGKEEYPGVELMNPLTADFNQLMDDIARIPDPQSGTPMGEALELAIEELINNGSSVHTQVIILLTDGKYNGFINPLTQADAAAAFNITIFTIGLQPGLGYNPLDEDLLMEIANKTGGEYYYAPNETYLKTIYQQIAQKVEYPNVEELFDSDSMLVTVKNVEPTIEPFGPFTSDEGVPIEFTSTVIDPGSDDLTFTWSWGDGTPDTVATYYNNETGPEPIYDFMINEIKSSEGIFPFSVTDAVFHTYGDNGVYTITLTVIDDDGGTTVLPVEVLVNNVWPTISVVITPSDIEGSELTFEAEANDPGSDDLTFTWEFEYGPTIENKYYNDGVNPEPIYDPSTNEVKSSEGTFPFKVSDSVTHTYGDDYNYSLILTVTDDDNGVSIYDTTIKINNMAPSITRVMIPYSLYEGLPLTFGARAEDQGSDDLTFQWNFGDSTPINTMIYYNDGVGPDPYPSPEGTYPFTATDTLGHTYGDDYDYPLTLTVTDDDGLSTSFTTKVIVYNVAPTIDEFGPFIINEGEPITITGTATDPGSDDLMFTWEFEYGPTITNVYYNDGFGPDPSPSPQINPMDILDYASHIYGDDGVLNVTLTVEDDDGDATTYTTNITVNNVAPTVTIESVIMNVEVGLRVAGRKFNNVSMTLYEDGNIIGCVSIERLPGSPDEQMAWIPVSINFSKSYNATVTYTPEDPPNVGGNPVWIYLKSKDGNIKKIHHTFNVQQSKKRDSEHWNHVEPWEVDLNEHFIGLQFEITSHIIDPGSDDEILTFTYGSQVIIITHLNNPPNLDPHPSPEVNPVDIMDTTTLVYEGPGTITLVVKDDDNIRLGVGQSSDSINIL